ncbi:hypothetical protein ACP4OV_006870 [Aristida adscensionis]
MDTEAAALTRERARSIPKRIKRIDAEIELLEAKKRSLMDTLEQWQKRQPRTSGEEEQSTSTGTPATPAKSRSKSKKKKKKKKSKLLPAVEEEAAAPGETDSPGDPGMPGASLPPSLGPGKQEALFPWIRDYVNFGKPNAPWDNRPTVREGRKDPAAIATAVVNPQHKKMLLRVADAVVNISYASVAFYEPERYRCRGPNDYSTGLIIKWDEARKKAWIPTCDNLVNREEDTKRKAQVRWAYMEDKILDAELLFFSKHYIVALLEIPMDVKVDIPTFGSYPKYGHEVFGLALDKELTLMARRGTVTRQQECIHLCHHHLIVDFELPHCGAGGPVIDRNGDVVGVSFHYDDGSSGIVSITTALACVDMWTNHSTYCSPMLGMAFKNVNFLDEPNSTGICDFIVDEIETNSTAWELGIRRGDVISFDGHCYTPLPKFEDFYSLVVLHTSRGRLQRLISILRFIAVKTFLKALPCVCHSLMFLGDLPRRR